MKTNYKLLCLVFVLSLFPCGAFCGLFDISVIFSDGVDENYKSAFNSAETFWETQITGYRLNSSQLQGVSINAEVAARDGAGGILGSAGPTGFAYGTVILDGDSSESAVCWSTAGSMSFDSADVDNLISAGSWEQVIRHEMAHVLGFGSLWGITNSGTVYNDFYTDGTGQYTGTGGLAAYQDEFDPAATFVPVELGGDPNGTANSHWDEIDNGSGLTGITDAEGNDMRNELMTGWLNAPTFVSNTTLGQFYDLGYNVIPEPATVLLLSSFVAGALFIRRRFV